ncbi:hypothetical protein GCM10023215_16720 [Pseudonocardia yuanmonensis]|uniref:Uncharacterized protein n=1 Tax=Pseudonocardia yuanmonensis TaxID=1095914 RepID=A0ABP8W6W8_9PSEU
MLLHQQPRDRLHPGEQGRPARRPVPGPEIELDGHGHLPLESLRNHGRADAVAAVLRTLCTTATVRRTTRPP